MRPYKSILVKTTLELDPSTDNKSVKLKLPFKVYGQNIVSNGKDITYRLNNTKLTDQEVLAKVDYCQKSRENITNDTEAVEKFSGNLGQDWETIQKDVTYIKHYNVKKEDALATYSELGTKVPYAKEDKDDLVKFTKWEEEVKEIKEVKEKPSIEIT
ncbi:MAG: hypothetical protein GY861_19275 [bacterium]|nr:hypothetical protein [bacterium]